MRLLRRLMKVLLFFIVFGGCIYGYSKYIEPKLLVVNEYTIENTKSNSNEAIKIVQFTDTHLGDFYSIEQLQKLVDKINEQNPDVVVFTGDLIDEAHEYEDIHSISVVLEDIKASLGKFAIWGNHDYGGGAQRHYENIMNEAGFTVLRNEVETIQTSRNLSISISGLDEVMMGHPDFNLINENLSQDNFNLLILHEPDLVDDFANSDVDLALAGHSHGGQINIPFFGPIITTAYGEKYTKGLYLVGEHETLQLYVNTGIGNTKLPYRFMNIPEISVFNIK
ncbi:MAG: metallophosphoesterase [Turicibacter sp.]